MVGREERREANVGGDEGRNSAKGSAKWGRQKGGERRGKIGKQCLAERKWVKEKQGRKEGPRRKGAVAVHVGLLKMIGV